MGQDCRGERHQGGRDPPCDRNVRLSSWAALPRAVASAGQGDPGGRGMRPEIQSVIDLLDDGRFGIWRGEGAYGKARDYNCRQPKIKIEQRRIPGGGYCYRLYVNDVEIQLFGSERRRLAAACQRRDDRYEKAALAKIAKASSAKPTSEPQPKKPGRLRRVISFTLGCVGFVATWLSVTVFVTRLAGC